MSRPLATMGLAVVLMLAACQAATPPPATQAVPVRPAATSTAGAAAPVATIAKAALPTPSVGQSPVGAAVAQSPLATPSLAPAGLGVASGILRRVDGRPLKGITVYAAPIAEHGGVRLASVDPTVDPRADTDAGGRFTFAGLPAGDYALAAQTPQGVALLQTETGETIKFTLAADKGAAIGNLTVVFEYPDNP